MSFPDETITLPVGKLQIGMYVSLPVGWMDHPFLVSNFIIKDQLLKLKKSDLSSVDVLLKKGRLTDSGKATISVYISNYKRNGVTSVSKVSVVPVKLIEALADKKMSSELKSRVVYRHSKELIGNLLKSPVGGCITSAFNFG